MRVAQDLIARYEAGDMTCAPHLFDLPLGSGAGADGPADHPGAVPAGSSADGANAAVEYEPDEEESSPALLPRNVAIQIYRAMLENNAGFYGAQMTAMDNATRNAGDMIQRLSIEYNRTRQARSPRN
jgi:F-type H+-transporting ATPase subunit gamma